MHNTACTRTHTCTRARTLAHAHTHLHTCTRARATQLAHAHARTYAVQCCGLQHVVHDVVGLQRQALGVHAKILEKNSCNIRVPDTYTRRASRGHGLGEGSQGLHSVHFNCVRISASCLKIIGEIEHDLLQIHVCAAACVHESKAESRDLRICFVAVLLHISVSARGYTARGIKRLLASRGNQLCKLRKCSAV